MPVEKRSKWYGIIRIFQFARPRWSLVVLTFSCIASYAALEMTYITLMAPIVNAMKDTGAIQDTEVSRLYHIAKIALILAAPLAITGFGQAYLQGKLLWGLVVDLRTAICKALLPQSLSFFEGRRSGDLMSRITNDAGRSQTAFRMIFGGIPQHVAHVLGGVVVAAMMYWQLLLVGAVVLPVLILPIAYLAKRIRRYGKKGLEKLSDLTDLMSQMFSGIRVIKAFKMEDEEVREFGRINQRFFKNMMNVVSSKALSVGIFELLVRLLIGGVLFAGTFLVIRHEFEFDLGRLCAFLGGAYVAFFAMKRLVKAYNEMQECIPAADRIFEMIEHVPELQDAPDAVTLGRIEKGIAFRNVNFAYDREEVLHDVSFEINRGKTVALIGRSGSGKSTLVALLCRFYDVTSGSVEIDGLDVRRITRDSLLDHIAIVSQQTFLFNRTIADNIRYGRPGAPIEEVEAAARAANIHEFIMSLENGYETMCGEFGAKLSGGQCQRIAIARAILKNADILILDEAMAGLDADSEAQVRDALANLMKGRTTFVISHDLPTIQNADRILVLKNGNLVGEGTHEDLIAKGGEYGSLYALQFEPPSPPQSQS